MHSKSPSVMAFCLVCLGILAKSMPKRLAEYSLLNSISYSPGLLVFYQNLLYNGKANKMKEDKGIYKC